jgi:4-hydroxy-4-methyl-2-oxoglutarate aldolase
LTGRTEDMGTPDPNVARLARLDSCAVSDALDKLGIAGAVTGLLQLSAARRIAGRVVTVKLGVGTPAAGPVRHLGTTAVEAAGPGDVIVVEQRSGVDAGSWGGILTLGAKLRGVAGVIADGPVRDIDEAKGYDFPVYARSCTSRTARGRIVELGTNVPVQVGDVQVGAGDYVIADASAAVFIRAEDIAAVLEAAEYIAGREAAMAAALQQGSPITEVMGANYEHLLKK